MKNSTGIYAQRKAAGLCPGCGGGKTDTKYALCRYCRITARQIRSQSYEELKREGKCVQCRVKEITVAGSSRCEDCKAKLREHAASKRVPKPKKPSKPPYHELRQEGRCVRCTEVSDTGQVVCSTCKTKQLKKEWLKYEQIRLSQDSRVEA